MMPLSIHHRNITEVKCDILVNPTDPAYSGRGGVDYAIHHAAGKALAERCASLPSLHTGEAVETPGFDLPCRYIIHTVGPVWQGGQAQEEALLRSCYVNALLLAARLGAKSVAFPLISSGTFGFPKNMVLRIAAKAISDFLFAAEEDYDIILCVYDRTSYEFSLQRDLADFLDENIPQCSGPLMRECCCSMAPPRTENSLEEWIQNHDDNFAVTLLKLIDKKEMTEVECYKKANVSRKTFSKINTDPHYRPSKATVLAFAVALELTLEETNRLLNTVGFSLSRSDTFDLIIEYYISNGIYDIYEINAALYRYDQVCLGC